LLLLKVSSGRFPGFWRGRQEKSGKRDPAARVVIEWMREVFGHFAAD
jgi:hypothetical protein